MKYRGSKSKVAKYIIPIIQSYITPTIKAYVEPFVGGCNVIDKIQCDTLYANDNNIYLIALFQETQKDSCVLPNYITREHYNEVRDSYKMADGKFEDWYIGAVGFLTSFNCIFFGGYSGTGIADNNRVRNYYIEGKSNLLNQIQTLFFSKIQFSCLHYEEFLNKNKFENCVIYFDPPYLGTKQYSKEKFDHHNFYRVVKKLAEKNTVIISEQYMPSEFTIISEQEVTRHLNPSDKQVKIERLYTIK